MDTNRTLTRKPRTKLKAINNFLMCCLCKGYIVEATAISDCLHSCEYFNVILRIFERFFQICKKIQNSEHIRTEFLFKKDTHL